MKKNQYFVYSLSDISEQYETIRQLKEKNERDPATMLWNKAKFHKTLSHYSQLSARYEGQYPCCLAIIDIDDFKTSMIPTDTQPEIISFTGWQSSSKQNSGTPTLLPASAEMSLPSSSRTPDQKQLGN